MAVFCTNREFHWKSRERTVLTLTVLSQIVPPDCPVPARPPSSLRVAIQKLKPVIGAIGHEDFVSRWYVTRGHTYHVQTIEVCVLGIAARSACRQVSLYSTLGWQSALSTLLQTRTVIDKVSLTR